MRFCSKCGYKLDDDQLYCPKCGNKEPLIPQDYDADQNMTSYKREKKSIQIAGEDGVTTNPDNSRIAFVSKTQISNPDARKVFYKFCIPGLVLSIIGILLALGTSIYGFVDFVHSKTFSATSLGCILNYISIGVIVANIVLFSVGKHAYIKALKNNPHKKTFTPFNQLFVFMMICLVFSIIQIFLLWKLGTPFLSMVVFMMQLACSTTIGQRLKRMKKADKAAAPIK